MMTLLRCHKKSSRYMYSDNYITQFVAGTVEKDRAASFKGQ
jgi:hypothetical protein